VWRLLYPRTARLGFFKKKESRKNAPNPRRGLAVCPVLLQALPIPTARLKFEKSALDLSAVRHIGVVNALAARSPHSLFPLTPNRNPTNPTDRAQRPNLT